MLKLPIVRILKTVSNHATIPIYFSEGKED